MHNATVDVGQAKVTAGMAEGQLLMVEAEQVQQRGVEIVHVHPVLHRRVAKRVGCSVGQSAFHAAAGHPHCEALGMMAAAVTVFRGGSAAKLSPPDH